MKDNKSPHTNTKKFKRIFLYLMCIVLVMFYLTVFWWGKNPKVPTEYRMYYITRELSDWPGYGKLMYEPGTTEYCTSLKDRNGNNYEHKVCRRKGQGFDRQQYEGSTNNATVSSIYYVLQKDLASAELIVDISAFSGNGEVQVYINDQHIGEFSTAGRHSFSTGEIKKDEIITVKFDAPDTTYTLWSIEIRELGK